MSAGPFLRVVQEAGQIDQAQFRLATVMTTGAQFIGRRLFSWRGGSAERDVHRHPKLDLWMCFDSDAAPNRYWNAFGIGNPEAVRGGLIPVVEINPPRDGINRSVAGAFAHDPDGELYLLHRGNVGGGRRGIGKSRFMPWYPGAICKVADGKRVSNAIVLGRIGQPDFQASVAAFVSAVDRFKSRENGSVRSKAAPRTFRPEFTGTKTLGPQAQIEAQCRHGIVVNSLQRILESMGYQAHNTQHIDLRIAIRHGCTAYFEVKALADRYAIYTGIGQLFFHGHNRKDVRIIVLPSNCKLEILSAVRALGIRAVLFSWRAHRPVFTNLRGALEGIPRMRSA